MEVKQFCIDLKTGQRRDIARYSEDGYARSGTNWCPFCGTAYQRGPRECPHCKARIFAIEQTAEAAAWVRGQLEATVRDNATREETLMSLLVSLGQPAVVQSVTAGPTVQILTTPATSTIVDARVITDDVHIPEQTIVEGIREAGKPKPAPVKLPATKSASKAKSASRRR